MSCVGDPAHVHVDEKPMHVHALVLVMVPMPCSPIRPLPIFQGAHRQLKSWARYLVAWTM